MVALGAFAIYVAVFQISNLESAREVLLRAAFFLLGIGLFGATIIIPILKCNVYCNVFQKYNKVEEYFQDLGISIEENNNKFQPLLILFKQLFVNGVIIATDFFFPYWETINLPIFGMIFYWAAMVVMTFVTVNCQVFAYLTVARYNAINNELENMDKTFKPSKIFSVNKASKGTKNSRKKIFIKHLCPRS